jgi:hypothetical protein
MKIPNLSLANGEARITCLNEWLGEHIPVIPALGRLRQEAHEFKASLGFIAS